jgi:hypothetical protein
MKSQNEKAARQLHDVRQFAKDKIATGAEPPWAWYQYMKLIESADAILASMNITKESSRLSALPADTHLQLVGSTYQPNIVQSHLSDLKVLMPM